MFVEKADANKTLAVIAVTTLAVYFTGAAIGWHYGKKEGIRQHRKFILDFVKEEISKIKQSN